jgi:hypothetical protein
MAKRCPTLLAIDYFVLKIERIVRERFLSLTGSYVAPGNKKALDRQTRHR